MSIRHHILIPIDLSSRSFDAFLAMRDVAFEYTDITLLYVYDPLCLRPPVTFAFAPSKFGIPQCVAQELLERLRQIRKAELNDFRKVNLEIVVSRDPAKAICLYTMRHRVDLMIIASRGSRDVSRLLNGSVTENVVRHARCEVTVIHSRPQFMQEQIPERLPLISSAVA